MMNPEEQADAIQMDVSTEIDAPTLTSEDSPRMRALAAIDAKNALVRQEEMGDVPDDSSSAQLTDQLAEPSPVGAPLIQSYKVKIDGVEQDVDQETLIRAYQKNSAADRRLEEATQILRNAQQLAAQNEAPVAPVNVPEQSAVDLNAQAADLVDNLMHGDTDTATKALVNLLSKSRGGDQPTPQVQAVDTDALASQVLERIAIESAFARVQSDYPEIIADPDLEALAVSKIDRLMATGRPRSAVMVEAAEEVYRLIGKTPNGRQQTPPPPTRNVRQENKERLDPVPAASAVAVSPQSPAESSPSALIAEMASRRLGQSLPQ